MSYQPVAMGQSYSYQTRSKTGNNATQPVQEFYPKVNAFALRNPPPARPSNSINISFTFSDKCYAKVPEDTMAVFSDGQLQGFVPMCVPRYVSNPGSIVAVHIGIENTKMKKALIFFFIQGKKVLFPDEQEMQFDDILAKMVEVWNTVTIV